jgi:hypothetical protein
MYAPSVYASPTPPTVPPDPSVPGGPNPLDLDVHEPGLGEPLKAAGTQGHQRKPGDVLKEHVACFIGRVDNTLAGCTTPTCFLFLECGRYTADAQAHTRPLLASTRSQLLPLTSMYSCSVGNSIHTSAKNLQSRVKDASMHSYRDWMKFTADNCQARILFGQPQPADRLWSHVTLD